MSFKRGAQLGPPCQIGERTDVFDSCRRALKAKRFDEAFEAIRGVPGRFKRLTVPATQAHALVSNIMDSIASQSMSERRRLTSRLRRILIAETAERKLKRLESDLARTGVQEGGHTPTTA